jgi:AcrR family transcriptional regulator
LAGEDRRLSILLAARRVFVECGFAGARTQRIADEAQVAEALLYRHFSSKEELFSAAVLDPLETMINDFVEATLEIDGRDAADRRRRIEAMHERLCATMLDVLPLLGIVLFSEQGRDFYRNRLAPTLARAYDVSESLLQSWPLRRPIDGRLAFTATFGMYLGVALDSFMRDEPVQVEVVSRQLADMVLRGLSAGGPDTDRADVERADAERADVDRADVDPPAHADRTNADDPDG